MTTRRALISLRQPSAAEAELVVTTDGVSTVHTLTIGQLKLLAAQTVKAVCGWPSYRRVPDTRDEFQRDYDEARVDEDGWGT